MVDRGELVPTMGPIKTETALAEGAGEADEKAKQQAMEAERAALDGCLKQLPEVDRNLLLACYSRQMKINEIAERLGRTPTSLYKKVNRLRGALLNCIKQNARPA